MGEKIQYFNNVKFVRDDKTGYYLNSTSRKRMHRYVWEYYNGEIPKGFQIHHIDHDKSNNDISNLEMISRSKHAKIHANERVRDCYDEVVENLNKNARPKASEWHGSKEGIEWHKKHYAEMKDKLYIKKEFVCKQCGKKFESTKVGSKFCCNNCKSKWRREQGFDNETRKCECCGKEFIVNKYSKTKTCSRECAAKLRRNRRNNV